MARQSGEVYSLYPPTLAIYPITAVSRKLVVSRKLPGTFRTLGFSTKVVRSTLVPVATRCRSSSLRRSRTQPNPLFRGSISRNGARKLPQRTIDPSRYTLLYTPTKPTHANPFNATRKLTANLLNATRHLTAKYVSPLNALNENKREQRVNPMQPSSQPRPPN